MRQACLLCVALSLAVAAASGTALAQVQAHQSTMAQEDPKQFASPMVLDLPLQGLDHLADGMDYEAKDIVGYYCEDVTITKLAIATSRGPKRSKGEYAVRLKLRGSLHVRASYDRFVTLRFAFSAAGDETILASKTIDHLKAEEKKSRTFSVSIDIPLGDYAKLAAGAKPTLRVAVIVASDK